MMIWPRRLTFAAVLLSVVGPLVPALRAQADARLPDGTQFQFWEKPFTPTKTYYVNGTTGNDDNPGTEDLPFKTIIKAAQIREPGELVELLGSPGRLAAPAQHAHDDFRNQMAVGFFQAVDAGGVKQLNREIAARFHAPKDFVGGLAGRSHTHGTRGRSSHQL